jgi:ABC-type glycerol-3-phosphate transport system permease component
MRWRGRNLMFMIVLIALMLPPQGGRAALRHVGQAHLVERSGP